MILSCWHGCTHNCPPPAPRRQLLLALAEWLCANYSSDATAHKMVTKMHLFLMPTMNPDGYQLGIRENA